MISKEEIRALLKRLDGEPADAIESEELECKSWDPDPKSLHRNLREHVVCLANARGGTIVLGVRDKVRTRREAIQGMGPYDLAVLRRAVYDGTEPHILVEIEELKEPEGTLLLVHVPKGMPPHTTSDGVARIRIGKECKPLTGRTFAQLLASGGQRDITAESLPKVHWEDLDPDEFVHLRQLLQRHPPSADLARLDDHAMAEALGIVLHGEISFAGLLLVGRKQALSARIPQHEVTFLRYQSATRYDQRSDCRGPLLAVLREMEQLVSVNNRVRTIQEKGFGQLELQDISWEVAREAVLNAVTHRDYFLRQSVQVALHRDRLEVISPGGFPGGITAENILRHPPIHRNEHLARIFQSVGLVNRVGLGVDRIFEGLLRWGKDVPRYSSDESHVRLCLPLRTNGRFVLFIQAMERAGQRLELEDLLILREFTKTAALDRWSAAKILHLSEEEAALRLTKLRSDGFLTVRGRGRGSSYGLRRDMAERLRRSDDLETELPIEAEAVRLRILALLKERKRLTNAEIRRFSGFSRAQVYRLVRALVDEKQARFVGKGRAAHVEPVAGK